MIRVPVCARVSRVCPGSPTAPPVSFTVRVVEETVEDERSARCRDAQHSQSLTHDKWTGICSSLTSTARWPHFHAA